MLGILLESLFDIVAITAEFSSVRTDFDLQMSSCLPESTRCLLRRFGLIDKVASLLKSGLLTVTDIEDASEHDLLAAGMDRDQIRHLRYVFVFREAFGLPDRAKSDKSRLHGPFEASPRLTTATSPTMPCASSVPHSASEMPSPSPSVQVASVQDAVSEAFRLLLGNLGLSCKESNLAEAGFAVPLDLKEALDDELQAAGLNMVQIRRVRRFFVSEECAVAGALTFTAAQSERVNGNGPTGDRAQRGGGASGVAPNDSCPGVGNADGGGSGGNDTQYSGPGGGLAQGGIDTGGASTSMAASLAAAAAVLVIEHDQK